MTTEQTGTTHVGHGNSVAAWTAVGIMLVGSIVVALAFVTWSIPIMIVGAVVILLGALSWGLLAKLGYGEKH